MRFRCGFQERVGIFLGAILCVAGLSSSGSLVRRFSSKVTTRAFKRKTSQELTDVLNLRRRPAPDPKPYTLNPHPKPKALNPGRSTSDISNPNSTFEPALGGSRGALHRSRVATTSKCRPCLEYFLRLLGSRGLELRA